MLNFICILHFKLISYEINSYPSPINNLEQYLYFIDQNLIIILDFSQPITCDITFFDSYYITCDDAQTTCEQCAPQTAVDSATGLCRPEQSESRKSVFVNNLKRRGPTSITGNFIKNHYTH